MDFIIIFNILKEIGLVRMWKCLNDIASSSLGMCFAQEYIPWGFMFYLLSEDWKTGHLLLIIKTLGTL